MQSDMTLSCLSYNIHKGFTPGNKDYVLEQIRTAIRNTQVDMVGLQEVLAEHQGHASSVSGWHPEAHFEFLADEVWPHFAYGKNAIYQQGHHGNALLSKYPLHSLTNHDLSLWRFSQRGLLHATLNPHHPRSHSDRPLHVACLHMGFIPYEQYRQTRQLSKWLSELPADEPLILMGDFNDWHNRVHRFLQSRHQLQEVTSHRRRLPGKTFPAERPRWAMDRIYYRGLTLLESEVLRHPEWAKLSDHSPVYAKFLLDAA